ncbi:alpha/beta fold hydrolase [Croceicoccus sp. F390]|uniref:Alpha/beta fold hydrolase n=1 Tax=Croceicoccus esteveae TaxID=3075597 RepID=A0ABU2ZHT5_9SPHN|nr:alpha/beta fold hydrolase [Croceicoccus sp. F390]MDT0576178.1 alpha/beta fold hydrolase [Croceicoccus sp. F390]
MTSSVMAANMGSKADRCNCGCIAKLRRGTTSAFHEPDARQRIQRDFASGVSSDREAAHDAWREGAGQAPGRSATAVALLPEGERILLKSPGSLLRELHRRRALAHLPQPDGVPTPDRRLLLREYGSLLFPHAIWPVHAPVRAERAGQPHLVMLIPGFGSHAWRMAPLRRALERAGHDVVDWGMGWNLGAREDEFARLCDRTRLMARSGRRKVTLVGWSLGGLFAREAAKQVPDSVGLVITMGTPFSGDMHGNNAWRVYHWIAGHSVDDPPIGEDLAAKPPVRTIALWSARDGIVHRRAAHGKPAERDAVRHVRCNHMGFAWHPAAAEAVLDLLAQYGPQMLGSDGADAVPDVSRSDRMMDKNSRGNA